MTARAAIKSVLTIGSRSRDRPSLTLGALSLTDNRSAYFFFSDFSVFEGVLADSLKGNTNRPRRTHPGAPGSHSFLRLLQKVFRKCLHS
jgi:hypothetical protein